MSGLTWIVRGNVDSIQWHLALVVLSHDTAKLGRVMKVMKASEYIFLANVIALSLQYDRVFWLHTLRSDPLRPDISRIVTFSPSLQCTPPLQRYRGRLIVDRADVVVQVIRTSKRFPTT